MLPVIYSLTCCDCTKEKKGTKVSVLKANPILYIKNFGNIVNGLSVEDVYNTEVYLTQVLKKGTHCQTIDELRGNLLS